MRTRTNVAKTIDAAVDAIADLLIERVTRRLKLPRPNGKIHLDMRCRVPGCGKRSRGPRFRYLCDEHRGISKAKAKAYLAQYRATRPT